MPILPGRRLGPYEILSAIGAGGMGEVYRARDTRLDRIVAIKVLPTHLADRSELRERFEREAKTIASLNHPHICVLHDIGHQDGIDFLVMEYIEGETLAQRLVKGALPIQQALQYAIEIADALDKAHRKGITHRDLKPGNIMLTKSGTKLLDFGLAKLKQDVAPATPESQLSTMKGGVTGEGAILGTLQYMAPEQVEGKEVDARTDIFAFGTVVYEMATGKRAFEGRTQASLIAKILEIDPPPISSLQPMTPPALDRVVKKCLAKEPDDRWHAAKDLCDELKWIAGGSSQLSSASISAPRSLHSRLSGALLWGGVSVLFAALIGFLVWSLKPSSSPQPVSRFTITLPTGQRLAGLTYSSVALSPDGAHLAYVATEGSTQQLYLRPTDSLESKPIPATNGATEPFFSPDSQSLGFFADGKLKKVSVSGGTAQALADALAPRGASWGSQGTITFAPFTAGPLQDVPVLGGDLQSVTHIENGENSHRWPEFLPGQKAVLYAAGTTNNWAEGQVAVSELATGKRRNLIKAGMYPRYAASGHLIYAQGGTLMAVPFDPQVLTLSGSAIPVVEDVMHSANGSVQYSLSATGMLVYVPAGGVQATQRKLVWVSRSGTEQALAAPAHGYSSPRISPDGKRVAVTVAEQDAQVMIYDFSRETLSRLTFEGTSNLFPGWTPDGKRISFVSNMKGPQNIFWQLADGSGGLERLTTSENGNYPGSWSPDGQFLAFVDVNSTTGYDIWVLRMSDHKVEPFLRTPFNETQPRFSPGGKWQISTDGGTEAVWNPNGRELFYRSGDRMMAVDIATQPNFSAGKPKILFERPYELNEGNNANYAVSPDGQRFLMLKPTEQELAAPAQINVVLNWFEELKQKVPTGKK